MDCESDVGQADARELIGYALSVPHTAERSDRASQPGQRGAVLHAHAPGYHVGVAASESEHHSAAAETVECGGSHSKQGGIAGVGVDDANAQPDALGAASQVAEHGKGLFVEVSLGDPEGVEAGVLGHASVSGKLLAAVYAVVEYDSGSGQLRRSSYFRVYGCEDAAGASAGGVLVACWWSAGDFWQEIRLYFACKDLYSPVPACFFGLAQLVG